jgi:predicted AAA+ superfamily ATPase
MFIRQIVPTLQQRLQQFPIVVLTGPRQSGKTTLLREHFKNYDYINLESPDQLQLLKVDPRNILSKNRTSGLIIDEAQKYPEAFSYIQVISDEQKQKGQFILSGSQNFLLSQQITQSLAGRAGILELLPLSYAEYQTHKHFPHLSLWEWLYQGSYPRPYQDNIPTKTWMDNYVRTYLERDVRDLLNVRDLSVFQRFLRLCAGRHGQLLTLSQLAIDTGVSHTTISHWLSILEASYIIFRLQPYYKNFSKRQIKSSKLYFYDAGLVCYLLGIDSAEHLSIHSSRGAIFEGYILSEIQKFFANQGLSQTLYFWRDNHGLEIDCLIEYQGKLLAIEIKSTSSFQMSLVKNLQKWQSLHQETLSRCQLIYTGNEYMRTSELDIIPWDKIHLLFQ